MLGYAPQRQMLPLISSRISSAVFALPSSISPTADRFGRCAVAALEGIMFDECLLQRMQLAVRRQAFDRGDVRTIFMTARVRHELTRRPSTSTVQAPH